MDRRPHDPGFDHGVLQFDIDDEINRKVVRKAVGMQDMALAAYNSQENLVCITIDRSMRSP